MTPVELAAELRIDPKALRAWLRRTWPRSDPGARWDLTAEQVAAARRHWNAGGTRQAANPLPADGGGRPRRRRLDSDETYVLDLLDELLGSRCQRQARFPWLLGDPGSNGTRVQLPVDGYWPDLRMVVEYRERQHDQFTPFFDKPDRTTISGVHRGQQRRMYDARRDQLIPEHGLRLLVVKPSDLISDARGRLLRSVEQDRLNLRQLLKSHGLP